MTIKNKMNKLELNSEAPDFSLVGVDLKPITKADYAGKNVVLLFIPLAFTSVCTQEMCTARDDQNKYQDLNAEVIGVSVDSPFVLKKFGEENQLNFKLGSDFNRTMSKDYDTLFMDDFAGLSQFSKRSAFIIDKVGKLRYIEMVESGKIPNFEKIQEVLKSL